MMASFMSWFGARKANQSAREALVALRQELQLIEKKEEYLQKKIDEELKKAKANVVSNKTLAVAALKRMKANEQHLDSLASTRLQLEMLINTLEPVNLHVETTAAIKEASEILRDIHRKRAVIEQREWLDEISEAVSNPLNNNEVDELQGELKMKLEELEQDALKERLSGAEGAPIHVPAGTKASAAAAPIVAHEDEEAQLRELQAALDM